MNHKTKFVRTLSWQDVMTTEDKIAEALYRKVLSGNHNFSNEEKSALVAAWSTRRIELEILSKKKKKEERAIQRNKKSQKFDKISGAMSSRWIRKWESYKPEPFSIKKEHPPIFIDGGKIITPSPDEGQYQHGKLELKRLERRLLEKRYIRENWSEFYESSRFKLLQDIDSAISKTTIWMAACDILNGRQRLNCEYFAGMLSRNAKRCHSLMHITTEWHNLKDICVAIDWIIYDFDILNHEHPVESLCFIWHSSNTIWKVRKPASRESIVIALFAAWLSYMSQLFYSTQDFAKSAILLALSTEAISKAEYSHDHCATATMVWMVAEKAEKLGITAGSIQAKTDAARASAEGKLRADPKQKHKAEVYDCWKRWQARPIDYKSKSAFARAMLDKYESLGSQTVITRWCTEWEKGENLPKYGDSTELAE